jgi:hypothetical protein
VTDPTNKVLDVLLGRAHKRVKLSDIRLLPQKRFESRCCGIAVRVILDRLMMSDVGPLCLRSPPNGRAIEPTRRSNADSFALQKKIEASTTDRRLLGHAQHSAAWLRRPCCFAAGLTNVGTNVTSMCSLMNSPGCAASMSVGRCVDGRTLATGGRRSLRPAAPQSLCSRR